MNPKRAEEAFWDGVSLSLIQTQLNEFEASSINAQEYCGRDDLKVVGDYTVYNKLWGQDNDKTGKQCTEVTGSTSSSVSWRTSFNWTGDSWQVKSFPNAALKFSPKQVSAITSMPTTMKYEYTYDGNITANVAYDLFTSSSATGEIELELMGMNKKVKVFSYVAKKTAKSFTADLKQFFDELPANNTLPQTQFLQKLEAGTEPFQGKNAKFVVSTYSVQVK
ncbi:cell 12A endoglucanase, putative [Phytophthora infestans T30-4]|uniref:Cell 12A endoglucanase, putative n=1 Tax=Phytophthora infestans (strain T30-4) TaxID=403677 RepID=D0NUJ2_PHYIT|nr:cell 12A endoglucanase, putative [Phytophthora infestans T30-4]EEY65338.1 cell 12A endoglucanase, putative [Phytophthora infestans T30-4]|eukprot:XP_002897201.1 cell 12A endoglucanase, putative [Phytophthora infestans T30-4]